jgi:hypothetical protein
MFSSGLVYQKLILSDFVIRVVSKCIFVVAAVPQLFFHYLCDLTKPIFAALPQNKDRRKMHFDTSPFFQIL